jgi:hypothetical protein
MEQTRIIHWETVKAKKKGDEAPRKIATATKGMGCIQKEWDTTSNCK